MSMMGYEMTFPIIEVVDKGRGGRHIVGTNSHDALHIDNETGGLHYYNLQCGEGTGEYGSYEFIGEDNEYGPGSEIRFVTFEELLEIYKKEVELTAEAEKNIREILAATHEKLSAELDKNRADGIMHT